MDALPPPCAADVQPPHSLAVERAIPRDSARAAAAVLGAHMRELSERGDRAGADRLQPAMTLLWTIAARGLPETLRRLGLDRAGRVVLTPDLAAALREAKAAGLSDDETGLRLGVGRDIVRAWRRTLGVPPCRGGRPRQLPSDAALLHTLALGRSVADLAAAYGVTQAAVRTALHHARRRAAAQGVPCTPLKPGRKRVHDWDAVLDAWAAGQRDVAIARGLGLPLGTVGSIVIAARRSGDPRAARRRGSDPAPDRRCLRCGHAYRGSGPHDRLCTRCSGAAVHAATRETTAP